MTIKCCQTAERPVSRESLVDLIQEFLSGRINSDELEEQMVPFNRSDDTVVRFVADSVSSLFDEETNQIDVRLKSRWDYVQRLLLLLSTTCRVDVESEPKWCRSQLFAAIAFAAFICLSFMVGWGVPLLFLSLSFGLLSFAISHIREKNGPPQNPYTSIIYPFPTIDALERAYRSSNFRKVKHPRHYDRPRRAKFLDHCQQGLDSLTRLLLSPLDLLFLMIPYREVRVRVMSE